MGVAPRHGRAYIAVTSNKQARREVGRHSASGAGGLLARGRILGDEKLKALIEPVVTATGFALVRVAMIGGERAPTLQVMAEDPATGQMTLEQCARLSRALSAMLDEKDPIEAAYRLEVSSPGIDRPLTRLADFDRWVGHVARIDLSEPLPFNGAARKRFQGPLLPTEGDDIRLEAEGLGPIALPFAAIRTAKLLLTDKLIAETAPLDASGADDIIEEEG
ncbi:LSm family protein [Sandaracinobacteroides saxicola]|uniref:Ribosome maturation factor RimP n=1 Tax=Sandaracinobacteroides saxicola TaxID=2759707 RepID=A0A7G5IF51_9SPHN|nr:ribosome maturation factor [Sandaracinobacteroides saxicola]QMW21993.1 ribosome maturation factor [Sandaracinobacteroides saxicola]